MTEQTFEDEITYCAIHPQRETGLRCNKCERLMCAECAVRTPVGYRCKECVRQVEDKFYNAESKDYFIVAGICAGLGAVAGVLISVVGFLILAIIIAFPVGGGIAEAALRATQRRRGRHNGRVGAAALAVGAFAGAALRLIFLYNQRYGELPENIAAQMRAMGRLPDLTNFVLQNTFADLSLMIFVGLAAFAVYSRYRV